MKPIIFLICMVGMTGCSKDEAINVMPKLPACTQRDVGLYELQEQTRLGVINPLLRPLSDKWIKSKIAWDGIADGVMQLRQSYGMPFIDLCGKGDLEP